MRTRVVVYYRMSSDKQEASIPAQRQAVESLAKRLGYKIIREYIDEGISGDDTESRVAFLQMREDTASGEFEAVLCWDQDRFGRFDPLEAGHWIRPFRTAGVRLETVTQGKIDWETFAGRLLFMIQQEGKHQYLRDLSRTVLRGHLNGFNQGRWQTSPPFGYDLVDGHLQPNEHAETVRTIFDLYVNHGHSLRSLAAKLNADGIPNNRCGFWLYDIIRKMLLNPAYIGHYRYGKWARSKYSHIDDAGQVATGAAKEPTIFTRENNHPAIVDEAAFAKAGVLLGRRRGQRNFRKTDYALGGLLFCSHCGTKMTGRRAMHKGEAKPAYECRRYLYGGTSACNKNSVQERRILPAITEAVIEFWGKAPALERATEIEAEMAKRAKPKKSAGSAKRIADLEAKITRGKSRLLTVPDNLYDSLIRELEAAETELAGLTHRETKSSSLSFDHAEAVQIAAKLLENLDEAIEQCNSTDVRNSLLCMISRIDLEFSHVRGPKRMRSTFERGTIHFKKPRDDTQVDPVQAGSTYVPSIGKVAFTAADTLRLIGKFKRNRNGHAA